MRVFKSHFKDPSTGKQRETEKWYLDFLDHRQVRRRMPTPCRTARDAERFGQLVEQLVICATHSEPLDVKLDTWLRSLSRGTLKRLAKFGLADEKYTTVVLPLSQHISDFSKYLATVPSSRFGVRRAPRYVAGTITQLQTIVDAPECHFRYWSDLSRAKVEMLLGRLRETRTARTCNGYLLALQLFTKWMISTGRGPESTVSQIPLLKQTTETERLVLEAGDIGKLIEATATAPMFAKMDGKERGLAYLLATETGFRVEELRSLKVGDFDFNEVKPYPFRTPAVRLAAGHCKNRRVAEQALRRDRAEQFREHFADRAAEDPVFPHMLPNNRTSDMIRRDAERAGIATTDVAGRVLCFHGLRHSLGTLLDRAGIPLAVRMDIMRHSKKSSGITLGVYTGDASLLEKRDAVEKLPALPWPGQSVQAEPAQVIEAVA